MCYKYTKRMCALFLMIFSSCFAAHTPSRVDQAEEVFHLCDEARKRGLLIPRAIVKNIEQYIEDLSVKMGPVSPNKKSVLIDQLKRLSASTPSPSHPHAILDTDSFKREKDIALFAVNTHAESLWGRTGDSFEAYLRKNKRCLGMLNGHYVAVYKALNVLSDAQYQEAHRCVVSNCTRTKGRGDKSIGGLDKQFFEKINRFCSPLDINSERRKTCDAITAVSSDDPDGIEKIENLKNRYFARMIEYLADFETRVAAAQTANSLHGFENDSEQGRENQRKIRELLETAKAASTQNYIGGLLDIPWPDTEKRAQESDDDLCAGSSADSVEREQAPAGIQAGDKSHAGPASEREKLPGSASKPPRSPFSPPFVPPSSRLGPRSQAGSGSTPNVLYVSPVTPLSAFTPVTPDSLAERIVTGAAESARCVRDYAETVRARTPQSAPVRLGGGGNRVEEPRSETPRDVSSHRRTVPELGESGGSSGSDSFGRISPDGPDANSPEGIKRPVRRSLLDELNASGSESEATPFHGPESGQDVPVTAGFAASAQADADTGLFYKQDKQGDKKDVSGQPDCVSGSQSQERRESKAQGVTVSQVGCKFESAPEKHGSDSQPDTILDKNVSDGCEISETQVLLNQPVSSQGDTSCVRPEKNSLCVTRSNARCDSDNRLVGHGKPDSTGRSRAQSIALGAGAVVTGGGAIACALNALYNHNKASTLYKTITPNTPQSERSRIQKEVARLKKRRDWFLAGTGGLVSLPVLYAVARACMR